MAKVSYGKYMWWTDDDGIKMTEWIAMPIVAGAAGPTMLKPMWQVVASVEAVSEGWLYGLWFDLKQAPYQHIESIPRKKQISIEIIFQRQIVKVHSIERTN